MTTSQGTQKYAEPTSSSQKIYFRSKARSAVHNMLLSKFIALSQSGELNKRQLAERAGVHPAQVTRWLAQPRNLTIETIADLLLAMRCSLDVRAQEFSPAGEASLLSPMSTRTRSNALLHSEEYGAKTQTSSVVRFSFDFDQAA